MKLTLLRNNKKIEVNPILINRVFKSPYGPGTVITYPGGYYLVKEPKNELRKLGFLK